MTVQDEWKAADVPRPIELGGKKIAVDAEPMGKAMRLRARFLPEDTPPPPSPDMLARVELMTPGDSRLMLDVDAVVAIRTLVQPAARELRDAAYALATALLAVAASAAGHVEQLAAKVAAEVPEPTIPESVVGAQVLGAYRTVRSAQPAWDEPNGTLAATGELRIGGGYHVLEMRDQWARVRVEDGRALWTDGRTLVALGEVPQAPIDSEEAG